MPIYSFHCDACGQDFDEICSLGETVLECSCGGIADKKITTFARYQGDLGSASTTPRGDANKTKDKLNFRKDK